MVSPQRVSEILTPLRQDLLHGLLRVGLIIAIPALATGVYASLVAGSPGILVIDIIAYLALILAYLTVRRNYNLAAHLFVLTILALGIVFVFLLGTMGASALWLATSVLAATLFLHRRGAVIVFSLALSAALTATVLLARGLLPWSIPLYGWLAVVGSFIGICGFLGIAIDHLFNRLARAVITEQFLSREVNHRVRNNLQLVESLLSIESSAAVENETSRIVGLMMDRVAAISHSFAHLDRANDSLHVDVWGLFHSLAGEQQHRGRPPVSVEIGMTPDMIELDTAVPLAIVVAELLGQFGGVGSILVLSVHANANDLVINLTDRASAGNGRPTSVSAIQRSIIDALVQQIHGTLILSDEDARHAGADSGIGNTARADSEATTRRIAQIGTPLKPTPLTTPAS